MFLQFGSFWFGEERKKAYKYILAEHFPDVVFLSAQVP